MSATSPQPESAERAGLVLEYGTLREEILKRMDIRHQLLSIALTLTGVFLGFGLSGGGENITVVLVYPALAALLAMGWGQNESRVRQLATHIREEIESRIAGLSWETCVQRRRIAQGDRAWRRTALAHGGTFLCTQVLAIGVGALHLQGTPTEWLLLAVDAASVIYVLSVMRGARR